MIYTHILNQPSSPPGMELVSNVSIVCEASGTTVFVKMLTVVVSAKPKFEVRPALQCVAGENWCSEGGIQRNN